MCGRYTVSAGHEALARAFLAEFADELKESWKPRYNITPGSGVVAILEDRDKGGRKADVLHWGLVPAWAKDVNIGYKLINARAETIAEKPAFRAAARERRCLIPASGFYEWTKDADGNRLPWYIHPTDGDLLAFAGVWQTWDKGEEPLTTCAIVTTGANETMSKIHHRMPVVLRAEDWPLWLGEAGKGAATLMTAAAEGALAFHRVDRAVNSNRASGPALIEAI